MPSLHRTVGSSHYLAHDDIPAAIDGDDISIRTTEEMEKYEYLRYRGFAHTRVYDVNLLERVGLDVELPTILWTIGWEKLYDGPRLGSRLLTLEFLMTFKIVEKNRKSFVMFCLFEKSFDYYFSCLSELLYFSKSCLPESSAMRNFNDIIHNPSLRFLHRWMLFTLFPMAEFCSVIISELKCMFAMVNRIE
jgi:hypothetical protein